jgi:hypothetical protein
MTSFHITYITPTLSLLFKLIIIHGSSSFPIIRRTDRLWLRTHTIVKLSGPNSILPVSLQTFIRLVYVKKHVQLNLLLTY